MAQFQDADRVHPNEALKQYQLSEALSEQDKPEVAVKIRAANRAIQLDPSSALDEMDHRSVASPAVNPTSRLPNFSRSEFPI